MENEPVKHFRDFRKRANKVLANGNPLAAASLFEEAASWARAAGLLDDARRMQDNADKARQKGQ